jgi:hypothetical protein
MKSILVLCFVAIFLTSCASKTTNQYSDNEVKNSTIHGVEQGLAANAASGNPIGAILSIPFMIKDVITLSSDVSRSISRSNEYVWGVNKEEDEKRLQESQKN